MPIKTLSAARTRNRREPTAGANHPPAWIKPQLAALVKEAPDGADWLHELKLDGYRMHARLDAGGVNIRTRRGNRRQIIAVEVRATYSRCRSTTSSRIAAIGAPLERLGTIVPGHSRCPLRRERLGLLQHVLHRRILPPLSQCGRAKS
jgi:hypothetical protein